MQRLYKTYIGICLGCVAVAFGSCSSSDEQRQLERRVDRLEEQLDFARWQIYELEGRCDSLEIKSLRRRTRKAKSDTIQSGQKDVSPKGKKKKKKRNELRRRSPLHEAL